MDQRAHIYQNKGMGTRRKRRIINKSNDASGRARVSLPAEEELRSQSKRGRPLPRVCPAGTGEDAGEGRERRRRRRRRGGRMPGSEGGVFGATARGAYRRAGKEETSPYLGSVWVEPTETTRQLGLPTGRPHKLPVHGSVQSPNTAH